MSIDAPRIKLKEEFQIVVFICYLLGELGDLTENQIIEIATLDDVVGVFQLSGALGVVEKKNLARMESHNGETLYTLTDDGRLLAEEFINRIPLSIREKSTSEGKKLLHFAKLRRSLDWRICETDGGYELRVKLFNEIAGTKLMELRLFSSSRDGAEDMERRFLENPSEIAEKIISPFIGGGDVVLLKDTIV